MGKTGKRALIRFVSPRRDRLEARFGVRRNFAERKFLRSEGTALDHAREVLAEVQKAEAIANKFRLDIQHFVDR